MKNIQFRIVFLLALGVFILDSCNDPKNTDCIYNDARLCDPAYQDSINSGGNGVDTIAFDPADLTTYDEKIFLEEFTGFRCTNCPAATAQANSLKDAYPDRLFLSSIHCTEIFAGPLPPADDPDDEFQIDLRTTEGAEWYAYYEPPGLPDGLINRLGNEFGPTIASPFWADRVSALITENNPEVYVNITGIEITNSATLVKIHATVKPINLDDENNPDDYISTP